MTESKMFYLALDYRDRRYLEDRQLAVVNTTREVFTGSNKILAPYLDPIKYRRLEMVYDARLMLMFYFFEVLIDQAVYTADIDLRHTFQDIYSIPKYFGILGGASNLPPEQLLAWTQIYNSSAFCGRLGNISNLFYRLSEHHFLIRYPRMLEAAHRKGHCRENLRFMYRNILEKIEHHMQQSYERQDRDVRVPYMEIATVKPDVQQYREWMHTVLSFSRNTLSNI